MAILVIVITNTNSLIKSDSSIFSPKLVPYDALIDGKDKTVT